MFCYIKDESFQGESLLGGGAAAVNFGFSIFLLFLLPFFLVHLLRMFELGREGGGEREFK